MMLGRKPDGQEAAVLLRMRKGDRIVTSRNGAGFEYERGMGKPAKTTVESLIDYRWILPPCVDGPLFGDSSDGTITTRGARALATWEACK
jgi:hypothetical protein